MRWRECRGPHYGKTRQSHFLIAEGYAIVPQWAEFLASTIVSYAVYDPSGVYLRAVEDLEYAKRIAREHRKRVMARLAA